jgi:hypothetical protein
MNIKEIIGKTKTNMMQYQMDEDNGQTVED